MLEDLLHQMGFKGETLGDKLKGSRPRDLSASDRRLGGPCGAQPRRPRGHRSSISPLTRPSG
ncbi:MAG: hypothetical protein WDN09_01830 [bacterium]